MNIARTVKVLETQFGTIFWRREFGRAWERVCPACDAPCVEEHCKVICRSERCVYLVVENCSE